MQDMSIADVIAQLVERIEKLVRDNENLKRLYNDECNKRKAIERELNEIKNKK